MLLAVGEGADGLCRLVLCMHVLVCGDPTGGENRSPGEGRMGAPASKARTWAPPGLSPHGRAVPITQQTSELSA